MHAWLIWIPVIAMFTGWLFNRLLISMLFSPRKEVRIFGWSFQGLLPKYQEQLAEKLGSLITESLPVTEIKNKVSSTANLQKIMPMVEEHIDHFLRVKLPAAMPVVGMFVGDKTISQLKAVFMTELETLFPVVMKEYMDQLESDFDLTTAVNQKMNILSGSRLEASVKQLMSKEFVLIQLAGILGGLITGLLQIWLILIFFK